MKNRRAIIFRVGAILLLLIIAASMMVIGRGHTVYMDNKTIEYDGQTYKSFYKVDVYVDGERVAKLRDCMAGLPGDVCMTEFVIEPAESETSEENVDEFGIDAEF